MSIKPLALFLVMILGFVALLFMNITDRRRLEALQDDGSREP